MRILYVFADNPREWNCSQWRAVDPAQAINDYTARNSVFQPMPWMPEANLIYVQEFAEWSEKAQELCAKSDIIIIQRLVLANLIERVIDLQSKGKIVIGEVDDAYHLMPDSLNSYKFWHEGIVTIQDKDGKPQQAKMTISPIEQLEWGMKMVNAITAPSEQLLEDWKKFNHNTYYIPNFIDSSRYLPHKKETWNKDRIVIGWGGSFSHIESWKKSNIFEALRKILEKNPNVFIAIAGGDKRIVEELKPPPGRMIFHDWVPFDTWPKILATFDIGLVPLAGAYDARRSYIKTLEYAIMGIPWVGTKSPPTEFFSQYGTTVSNSVEAWRRGIQHVIDNYDKEKEKIVSAFEIASNLDIYKKAEWLVQKYQEIWENRHEETV